MAARLFGAKMRKNLDELANSVSRTSTAASESKTERNDGILKTRLFPPQQGGSHVNRSDKVELASLAMANRLVLVRAPAGYGKTTSLADCYWKLTKASHHTAWISLSDFDGTLHQFVRYLGLAWNEHVTNGFGLEAFPWHMSTHDTMVGRFSEILTPISGQSFLFLDDFHAILRTDAEKFVASLIKFAPDNLRVLIASRSMVTFGVGRLRAQGGLAEVGVEALRFSAEEARQLLQSTASSDITPDVAEMALEKTEGWAAGLRLLSFTLRRSNEELISFLTSFSGSNRSVSAFLTEEVQSKLSSETHEFLLGTSILDRFCAPLCDEVLGRDDSVVILKELEQCGLFLFSLDEDECWYRYHHLFSEHLLKRLRERLPHRERELRKRASAWFGRNGHIGEAIAQSLMAQDFELAAQFLDRAWDGMQNAGSYLTFLRLAEQLPLEMLARYPRIGINRASALILSRKFGEAAAAQEPVFRWLESAETVSEPGFIQEVRFNLRFNDVLLARLQDNMVSVELVCSELIDDPPPTADFNLMGLLNTLLLCAQREQYQLSGLDQLAATATRYFQAAKSDASMVWSACSVGQSLLLVGRTSAARTRYTKAMSRASQLPGHNSSLLALPAVLMAELHLECFELDEARELISRHLPYARELGLVDGLIAGYLTKARLEAFAGDDEQAEAVLREGLEIAQIYKLDRLSAYVFNERIKQALARNDIAEAERTGREAGLPESATSVLPVKGSTSFHEMRAVAWARLAVSSGRYSDALTVIRRWLSFAESHGCIRPQIRMGTLATKAQLAAGDNRAALRSILRVIDLSVKSELKFPLFEEGRGVLTLVAKGLQLDSADHEEQDDLRRIVDSINNRKGGKSGFHVPVAIDDGGDTSSKEAPCEALTQREIGILKLAGQGLLVKQIADQVGMTEGAVKWCLHQLYGKLGAGNRITALQRASQLGFLG